MNELVALLSQKKICIGSCESLTAGLFASKLAEVPGASAVLKGAVVTYQTVCKEEVLHISPEVIARFGVVSEEVAVEMAQKAKALLHVDLCVSFTGNAGPSALEGKPAGSIYCAVAFCDQIYTYHFQLQGERNRVRQEVVNNMIQEIIQIISS